VSKVFDKEDLAMDDGG